MSVVIRKAVKEDCKKIRVLIQELADYEKMPDGPKISAEVLEADGFGDETFFRCFVAEQEENVILTRKNQLKCCKMIMFCAACWLCSLLLYILHLGRQASVYGGSVCTASVQRKGHWIQGDLNQLIN